MAHAYFSLLLYELNSSFIIYFFEKYFFNKGDWWPKLSDYDVHTIFICFRFLLSRGALIDQVDNQWRNCLHIASACSDPETVKILLEVRSTNCLIGMFVDCLHYWLKLLVYLWFVWIFVCLLVDLLDGCIGWLFS